MAGIWSISDTVGQTARIIVVANVTHLAGHSEWKSSE